MKKILAFFLCGILVFGVGCNMRDFIPSSTSSISQTSENIFSSVSISGNTSSTQTLLNTVSGSQTNSFTSTPKTESESSVPSKPTESTQSTSSGSVEINPYAKNHCYNSITAEQQRIYRILYSAIKNVTIDFIWLGSCSENYLADIAVAYRAVTYDYPEFFWVPYSYVVNKEKENSGVRLAFEQNGNDSRKYLVPSYKVAEYKQTLEERATKIISEVESLAKTPYEKVLYLHDLLIKKVKYSSGTETGGKIIYNDLAYTAYGAIVNGDAVCEGYSKAMSYLCSEMEIENILITGTSRQQVHMWNIVCIENKWYHIDTTWDDAQESIEYPLHTYFCVTDEQINLDHKIDPDISEISLKDKEEGQKGYNFSLPSCISVKYNYFKQNNYYIGNDLAAVVKLIEGIYQQQKYIELKFETVELFEEFNSLEKREKDIYLLSISRNVATNALNGQFNIKKYALIGDCLYIEW